MAAPTCSFVGLQMRPGELQARRGNAGRLTTPKHIAQDVIAFGAAAAFDVAQH